MSDVSQAAFRAPYGQRQALDRSQQQIPLATGPDAPPSAVTGGAGAPGRMAAAMQAAQQMEAPTGLFAQPGSPTADPNVGLPTGPGMGPDDLALPQKPVTNDDWMMARYLPILESVADQPGASMALRQYVRRVRASLPPQVTQEALIAQQGGME